MSERDVPEIRRTPNGWLALAPDGDEPQVGAVGNTREEATERFVAARRRWRELAAEPASA